MAEDTQTAAMEAGEPMALDESPEEESVADEEGPMALGEAAEEESTALEESIADEEEPMALEEAPEEEPTALEESIAEEEASPEAAEDAMGVGGPITVEEFVEESDTLTADSGELLDNDMLFEAYAQRLFYGDSGIMPLANYGQEILEGPELVLYQVWRNAITSIAANGGSTQMPVPADFYIRINSASGMVTGEAVKQELNNTVRKVINCLMVDCPYEFYWFDKVTGYSYSYSSYTPENTDGAVNVSFVGLKVTLKAAVEYQSGGNTMVSGAKAQKTAEAAARAREIVAANAGKSDYEKLVAYKDEICRLVSYNYGALSGVSYGNPWQLIYVFDGDPSTNVVCEGYAKAFQYLCDMTDFAGDVVCYTVDGVMSTGSGGGDHMWNIVTLEGKNYLVDVTNSDSGTIGQSGSLFLAGGTGSVTNGYRVSGATYTYHYEQKNLYGERILTLSSTSYTAAAPGSITNLSMEGWVYGSQPKVPTCDTTNVGVSPVIEYKEKGAGAEAYRTETPTQAGDYVVKVSFPGTGQYSAVSATAEFTIAPRPLAEEMVILGDGPFFYTGGEVRPAAVEDGTLITSEDYDIQYSNNISVGNEAQVTVTGKGNYQGTIKKTFVISYITPPQSYLTGSLGMNGWYTSDVRAAAKGWEVSQKDTALFTDYIVCSQEGEALLTLYFKQKGTSCLTEVQNVSLKIDKTAPVGRIQLDAAWWDSFLETITFGYYEAENLTVTITGEDSVSGILDLAYYISDTPLAFEELKNLTGWKEYHENAKPELLKNRPQVVYARIRDKAGNVSYLSTDGVIVGTKAPGETEGNTMIKQEVHEGITEITQTLAEAGFDTTEKISQEMKELILEHGYEGEDWALYDVKPMISYNGGIGWESATVEDFPKEGLLITLPYPQGTSKERHTFFAAHMFSHEMNGFQPGDIEIPKDVKAGEEGIQFTVYGLSPIAVAWKETEEVSEPGNGAGNGGNDNNGETNSPGVGEGGSGEGSNPPSNSGGGSGEGSNLPSNGGEGSNSPSNGGGGSAKDTGSFQQNAKAGSAQRIPRTGDTANVWFYELCLLISAICAECLYICFRKDKKKAVK